MTPLLALVLLLSQPPARPMPPDQIHEPLRRNQEVILLSEMSGQYLAFNGARWFVHRIAMARGPEGQAFFTAMDVERPGERVTWERPIEELPQGTIPALTLNEAFGLGDGSVWWADDLGEVSQRRVTAERTAPFPGRTWRNDRCTSRLLVQCVRGTCPTFCGSAPTCECAGAGHSCAVTGGLGCLGACGVGACEHEPVMDGCTCQ